MHTFEEIKNKISIIAKTFKHLNSGFVDEGKGIYRLYLEPQGFTKDEAFSKARLAYKEMNKILKAENYKYIRTEELSPVKCGNDYPKLFRYRLNIYFHK